MSEIIQTRLQIGEKKLYIKIPSQKYNIKEINNYICFFKYSFSIMMWKYIYAAFLMIAFTACHTNKTLEKSDKPASTANYTLPEHLSVSASFRMFWDAWNADLRQSGNNLEKYIPSELLIKRFSLHNQNGNYLLTGYLHTAADFKEENLLHIGGHCIKYNDSIYSFAIPLKILPQFITLPGITYIECSSPVRNR